MIQTTDACQGFCCSRWIEQQQVNKVLMNHPLPLSASDLDIPIHRILSPEHFPGVSKHDYDNALSLPLRLVSHLFTMSAFSKYVVVMCEGDVHIVSARSKRIRKGRKATALELNHPKTAISRYPKPEHKTVNHAIRSKAKRIMTQLVNMVEFEIGDCGGTYGRAMPVEGALPKHYSRRFKNGCRTKIRLSSSLFTALVRSKAGNPGFYRRNALFFATNVLHELSHAIGYAVDGLRFPEAYYGSCPYAERGSQIEQQIFGGILRALSITFETCGNSILDAGGEPRGVSDVCLVLEKWPSAVLADDYRASKAPMGTRVERKPYAEVTLVSEKFVAKLFTKNFWENEATALGSGPLRPNGLAWWLSRREYTGKERKRRMCSVSDDLTQEHWHHVTVAGRRQAVQISNDWVNWVAEAAWMWNF